MVHSELLINKLGIIFCKSRWQHFKVSEWLIMQELRAKNHVIKTRISPLFCRRHWIGICAEIHWPNHDFSGQWWPMVSSIHESCKQTQIGDSTHDFPCCNRQSIHSWSWYSRPWIFTDEQHACFVAWPQRILERKCVYDWNWHLCWCH